jgi:hypothetical protein
MGILLLAVLTVSLALARPTSRCRGRLHTMVQCMKESSTLVTCKVWGRRRELMGVCTLALGRRGRSMVRNVSSDAPPRPPNTPARPRAHAPFTVSCGCHSFHLNLGRCRGYVWDGAGEATRSFFLFTHAPTFTTLARVLICSSVCGGPDPSHYPARALYHQQGTYTVAGSVYVGAWVNDECEGQGVVTFDDGTKYDGAWKAGKRYDGCLGC